MKRSYYELDWVFWLGKFYFLLKQFLLNVGLNIFPVATVLCTVGLNFISGCNSFMYSWAEFYFRLQQFYVQLG